MKYIVTIVKGYTNIEAVFDNFDEASSYIKMTIEHCNNVVVEITFGKEGEEE